MANLFSRKIKGEEHRSQLQAVVFSDENKSIAALKKSQIDNYDELESYKKLRKRRVKIACLRMFVWLSVIVLLPIFVFFSIIIINPNTGHNFFGYTFFIVETDSMKPVFNPGDCIIVKKVTSYDDVGVGKDIAFVRKSDGETVTHRIIDVKQDENGKLSYVTRGVHITTADPGTVEFEDIIGVRVRTVAWLGQTVTFFRTPYGIVTFLILFVSIIAGFYISFRISDDIRAVGLK